MNRLLSRMRLLSRTRRLAAASVHTEAKLTELGYTLPTVYVAIAVVALYLTLSSSLYLYGSSGLELVKLCNDLMVKVFLSFYR